MADYTGQQVGNYRLLNELASGAFGSVYLAQHVILTERKVAVKLLHTYLRSSQEREQFVQEAQFLEQLQYPHILPLLDVGLSENLPYLVMKYASGGSLRDRMKRLAPNLLPTEQVLTILSQVGKALQYAHQKNVIHRDLKPENILFTDQNEALLADFGIATMLSTVSMKHVTIVGGTPPYMAPEQFQGNISKESDQYALACIAYELFTGQLPFSAPDFVSMGFKHITEQPAVPTHLNPNIPSHIEKAVLKAMAKQRSERYSDIATFVSVLSQPTLSQAKPFTSLTEDEILTVRSSRFQENIQPQPLASELPQPSSEPVISLPPTQLATSFPLPPTSRTEIMPFPEPKPQSKIVEIPREREQTSLKHDEKVNGWSIGRRQIIATLVGTILYALLEKYYFNISSNQNVLIPGLLILLFFGTEFGPWVGLFIGIVGGLISQSIFYSGFPDGIWIGAISSSLTGFIAGLAFLQSRGRYNSTRSILLADVLGALGVVIGIVINLFSFKLFFNDGFSPIYFVSYPFTNVIFCGIILPILLLISHGFVVAARREREANKTTY